MNNSMLSRDRMLAAIDHRPVDHVPMFMHTYDYPPPPQLAWHTQYERAQCLLGLGLDDMISLYIAESVYLPAEVRVHDFQETRAGEEYPVLSRVYETPDGTLRHVVRRTPDYPFSEIPLMNDFNVPAPRVIEYPIKSAADLPALRWLLRPPDTEAREAIDEEAREHRRFCKEHGLLFTGWGPRGTDALMWLCGMENAVLLAVDEPEVYEELSEIMFESDAALQTVLTECGVQPYPPSRLV